MSDYDEGFEEGLNAKNQDMEKLQSMYASIQSSLTAERERVKSLEMLCDHHDKDGIINNEILNKLAASEARMKYFEDVMGKAFGDFRKELRQVLYENKRYVSLDGK